MRFFFLCINLAESITLIAMGTVGNLTSPSMGQAPKANPASPPKLLCPATQGAEFGRHRETYGSLRSLFKGIPAVWLGILVLAIANGALREAVRFSQRLANRRELIISGFCCRGLLF